MRLDGDEYRRHDAECSLAKPCSTCEAEELERYEKDEESYNLETPRGRR